MADKGNFFKDLFVGMFEKHEDGKPDVGPIPVSTPPDIHGPSSGGSFTGDYAMPRMKIRFKGVFDVNRLYKKMVLWIKKHGYEFQEQLYKEKMPELEIVWNARKRKTGYIMDRIYVHIHIFDMETVEVIEKGARKKLAQGRLTITMLPIVETGYADIYEHFQWNSVFQRRLMSFYNKYVIKKDLDLQYTDALWYDLYNLHAFAKDILKLEARGNMY